MVLTFGHVFIIIIIIIFTFIFFNFLILFVIWTPLYRLRTSLVKTNKSSLPSNSHYLLTIHVITQIYERSDSKGQLRRGPIKGQRKGYVTLPLSPLCMVTNCLLVWRKERNLMKILFCKHNYQTFHGHSYLGHNLILYDYVVSVGIVPDMYYRSFVSNGPKI